MGISPCYELAEREDEPGPARDGRARPAPLHPVNAYDWRVSLLSGEISPEELAVWRTLGRAQVTVTRRLEAALTAYDLALASFDVLQQLADAPGGRLRMNDLADRVLLSRSGLTRLVDRLQREGLVERESCLHDARGLYAVLTPAGRERLRAAMPAYLATVREYFLNRITADELRQIMLIAGKLLDGEDVHSPA